MSTQQQQRPLRKVSLDDKFDLNCKSAFMSGIQALVRLPLMQQQRDQMAGLNTACFISGYRGSPLGSLDQTLWKNQGFLKPHHIHFQPGLNEDLAATSVWGSQQVNMFEGAKCDGVYAMWYGKGPGVDRCGDVFKHANAAGTSKYGGVLAVAGDDHGAKSSTLPHQSEHAFMAANIPVLNPASVQEVLDYGIYGWALSRYSGCWVALKAITENMESAETVNLDAKRISIVSPTDFELPSDGVHIRWPDTPLAQEQRLNTFKIYAARSFSLANHLNEIVIDSPNPRLGIITTGKSYLDVLQALRDLGIDESLAAQIGLRVFKVGMSWPLEPVSTHQFAKGLQEVLVVEEKRSVIEDQLTGQLYNWPVKERPCVIGEFDEYRHSLLTNVGELTPAMIARVIAARIEIFYTSKTIQQRLKFLTNKEASLARPREAISRVPHYCSGCPHNTSTKVPQGSRALGGIGCHYMATWIDPNTATFTQMGGEGATWIGQAPFTETKHVFQNLGDGTYFHSGILGIRAAIAAGTNITFKLLYNDAVAMTGGQPLDGTLTIEQLSHQLYGEGIRRILVVSDFPNKYANKNDFAVGCKFYHRDKLDYLQTQLREEKGVSVIIYDQVCAAEKRRRRKRGTMADIDRRVFINHRVCEGCGDCGETSNCLSVVPKETDLGRKREIDQGACNKDFSCVNGFCPSFVSVYGAQLRDGKINLDTVHFSELPEPQPSDNGTSNDEPFDVIIAGIGGTGVVTTAALLGMAAHIEGKSCKTLDMTGLSQKFGAVISHVRIADKSENLYSSRIPAGDANLLLGCDLVVSTNEDALAKLDPDLSYAIVNDHKAATSEFTSNPDAPYPEADMKAAIRDATGAEHSVFVNTTKLAKSLLGTAMASNILLLGYAYQLGRIPVSAGAIDAAIDLNGVDIENNKAAFNWGRRAANEPERLQELLTDVGPSTGKHQPDFELSLKELIRNRSNELSRYQNKAYAKRYRKLVALTQQAEQDLIGTTAATGPAIKDQTLSEAVARNYFKLLAYKDEYEVARLYSDGEFSQELQQHFKGKLRIGVHLAPPLIAKKQAHNSKPRKLQFGPWVFTLFKILAKAKVLRGTHFDPFGHSTERRQERRLISDYETLLHTVIKDLSVYNYDIAVNLAKLPTEIRGFGHIKSASIDQVSRKQQKLLEKFSSHQASSVRIMMPASH